MIHVSVTDRAGIRTLTFARTSIVIGCDPTADLILDEGEVARSTIRVTERNGGIVVEDVHGRHPTRTVTPDEIIRLAKVDLQIWSLDDTEHVFLESLRKAPSDAVTRAVYADWLEERGHLARAEYLRMQLAAGDATAATDAAFQHAAGRVRILAREVGHEWRAAVGMVFVEHCPASPHAGTFPVPQEWQTGLELVCPMQWEKLAPTDRDGVRACEVCKKDVTYVTSHRQAVSLTHSGHCIAVELHEIRYRELGPRIVIGLPKPVSPKRPR